MKRIVPSIIIFFALLIAAIGIYKPWIGGIIDTWQTEHGNIKIRIDVRQQRCSMMCGNYFVFQSASANSDNWHEFMVDYTDYLVPIPSERVRFVNDDTAYVFLGSEYAVTTDGGASWSIWESPSRRPIKDVTLTPDGTGIMTLSEFYKEPCANYELHTKDFGRNWNHFENIYPASSEMNKAVKILPELAKD